MRVFDVIHRSGRKGGSARIAVTGTCRVNDPFEELAERGKAIPVWANINSATHTLGESKQIIDYTRGHLEIPPSLRQFIFSPAELPPRAAVDGRILDDVDTIFVEVCDLRQVWHAPYYLQMNSFWTNFISKYGAAVLDWYRNFSLGLVATEEEIAATIEKLNGLSNQERAFVDTVMRRTVLQLLDAEAVTAGIADIMFDRSKNWVFVSHFVVPGLGGTQMADRAKLIEDLRTGTSRQGAKMFDPSAIIAQYGREASLAKEGHDFYHYNPQLHETIANALLDAAHLEERRPRAQRRAVDVGSDQAPTAETRPIAVVAKRINDTLVRLHRDRVETLGVDGSGLYEHYKRILDDGSIVDRSVIQLAELIVELLPPFDNYHVMRAGLGELAFVLAGLGLRATAYEQNICRFDAIVAGLQTLANEDAEMARRLAIGRVDLPDVAPENRILAVAHHLIGYPPEEEERVLADLGTYHALLIEPRIFLRYRESDDEREAIVDRLRRGGFPQIREFPGLGLVYCEREATRACDR